MPAWVEDPSLGNVMMDTYRGLEAAPGKALSNMATADEIKRKRKQDELDMAAINAFKLPEASVLPRRFTAADIANPAILDAPLSALRPASAAVETLTPGSGQIVDPVALAERQREREFALQNARQRIYATHGEAGMNALGMGRVAARGPGATLDERTIDQFYTTGRYPTAEERSAPQGRNYTIPNPQGGDPQVVTSFDNRTIAFSGGVPLPPGAVSTGPAAQEATNPIKDAATAQNNFNRLAADAITRLRNGQPLTEEQTNEAINLRNAAFQREVHKGTDPATGKDTYTPVYKYALPAAGATGDFLKLLDAYEQKLHLTPAAPAPAAPAADPLAAVPPPGTPAAPAAPAAPPVTPIVPRDIPIAGQPQMVGTGKVDDVVKQYTNSRQYDMMAQARQGYNSMMQNMEYDTSSADLAIVIGAAKALDPPSVVRYEESRKVEDLQTIPAQLQGMLARVVGGGKLGDQVRAELWTMVNNKTKQDLKELNDLRETHAVQVRQRGGDPEVVLPKLPGVEEVDVGRINKKVIDASGASGPTGVKTGSRDAAAPAGLPAKKDLVRDQVYTLPNGGRMKWTGSEFAPL